MGEANTTKIKPSLQVQRATEIPGSTRFALSLLVRNCIFKYFPIARSRHVARCTVA